MSPVPEVTQAEATYPSKDGSDHTIEWTPAYFNPPLAAERNGWVLNQLRRYSIRTVSLSFAASHMIYAPDFFHVPCDILVVSPN